MNARFRNTALLWAIPATLVLAMMAASGCGGSGDDSGGRLRVVTSLELFADMVRNVAGERAEVSALLPSGADPHTYELAPARVVDVARADVAFINGLDLEGGLSDVIRENASGSVVELAEGLAIRPDGNPHLWLDAELATGYVERILLGLAAADPDGAATYAANAAAYADSLVALDGEMEAAVASIPAERRKLVTFHDAFPYLAEGYGLELVGVVATSPGQEPSARAISDLIRAIRDQGVPAVFTEPQFNADILESAADEAGVRVLDLLSDAFIDGVESYIELMRFNAAQLVEGLRAE